MSQDITIGGNVISFPSSGEPADWSQPIIDFATDVQNALSGVVGPSDISPQSYDISTFNGVSNQNIPALTFSTSTVRSAVIEYSVYRTTNTSNAAESGTLTIFYNTNAGTGQKWNIVRTYQGDGLTTFAISDAGQISFSNTSLSGSSHAGKIAFSAKCLLQS